MAKYKINGKMVSGTQLIKLANREFTKNSQGRGRYGRPKTHDNAHYFLTSGTNSNKFKVKWWSPSYKKWV